MVQRRERLRFALKSRDAICVNRERLGEDLDRDVATEPRVPRAIHFAHSAFAKFRDDFIGSDSCAYLHRLTLATARSRRSSRAVSASGGGPPAPICAVISY